MQETNLNEITVMNITRFNAFAMKIVYSFQTLSRRLLIIQGVSNNWTGYNLIPSQVRNKIVGENVKMEGIHMHRNLYTRIL